MTRLSRPILAARALLAGVALALAAAALAPAPAGAEPSGFYASASGLYIVPRDHESIPVALPPPYGANNWHDLGMEPGAGMLAAVGRAFGERWRGEVEIGYREANVGTLDGWSGAYSGAPLKMAGGVRTLSAMLNGYYRFDVEGFAPYVGAGIGLAGHRFNARSKPVTIGDVRGHFVFRGHDTVFAWQAMAGVTRLVADNVELRLGYRFFGTRTGQFGGDELGYETHNLELGLSFGF